MKKKIAKKMEKNGVAVDEGEKVLEVNAPYQGHVYLVSKYEFKDGRIAWKVYDHITSQDMPPSKIRIAILASVKTENEIKKEKTWVERFEAGNGLTVGHLKEGTTVKIGKSQVTIVYKNSSRVQVRDEGGQLVNIAPNSHVDEIVVGSKTANGSVTRPASRSKKEGAMAAKKSKKVSNGTDRKVGSLFDFSVTSVLRWMGKHGLDRAEAKVALEKLSVKPLPADSTIHIQINAGKTGDRGEPAALTQEQGGKVLAASGKAKKNGGNGNGKSKAKAKAKGKKRK